MVRSFPHRQKLMSNGFRFPRFSLLWFIGDIYFHRKRHDAINFYWRNRISTQTCSIVFILRFPLTSFQHGHIQFLCMRWAHAWQNHCTCFNLLFSIVNTRQLWRVYRRPASRFLIETVSIIKMDGGIHRIVYLICSLVCFFPDVAWKHFRRVARKAMVR